MPHEVQHRKTLRQAVELGLRPTTRTDAVSEAVAAAHCRSNPQAEAVMSTPALRFQLLLRLALLLAVISYAIATGAI